MTHKNYSWKQKCAVNGVPQSYGKIPTCFLKRITVVFICPNDWKRLLTCIDICTYMSQIHGMPEVTTECFFFFFCCSWVMATINISTQPSRIRLLGDGGQINLRDAPLDFYGGRGWFLGKNSLLAVEMKTKIVCFVGFVGLGKKGLVKKMFPIPTPTLPPQTKMVANKILFCPPIYNGASLSTQSRVQR